MTSLTPRRIVSTVLIVTSTILISACGDVRGVDGTQQDQVFSSTNPISSAAFAQTHGVQGRQDL